MDRIVTILRAAHCRSTHHYFAIDALNHIGTAQGLRLRDLLLKYHDDYLIGATAPDKSFKDFQNHVLHVGDNYWGGAPGKCQEWLVKTLSYLDRGKWKKAAFACGVLSHYFTDPIMPLHTAQSDRESIVHRPMEWSICKAYDVIAQPLADGQTQVKFHLASSRDWIIKAVIAAAELAHGHYDRLVEVYDVTTGSADPPNGLNEEAREILGELFAVAITGWGSVLARIADETTADIPKASLTLPTLLATIDMPLAWIVRRISEASEQRAVAAICREFAATGTVVQNLPPEIRSVQAHSAAFRNSIPTTTIVRPSTLQQPVAVQTPIAVSANTEQSHSLTTLTLPEVVKSDETTARIMPTDPATDLAAPLQFRPLVLPAVNDTQSASVSPDSNLVDAPAIGPKTAARFAKIGIETIAQFLAADPQELAVAVKTSWINASLVSDWQAQAKLVCQVPGLCGYKSQLLVAVQCRTAGDLAIADPTRLHARLLAFCSTTEGQRILRSGKPPSAENVAQWVRSAQPQHRAAA